MSERTLKAWCNEYDVVAARDAAHATEVVMSSAAQGGPTYESADEAEGDGWRELPLDMTMRDENGQPMEQTLGQLLDEEVQKNGGPCYLYGVET